MISLPVNFYPITFEIDTGSSHTIISSSDLRHLRSPVLSSSDLRLQCYSGQSLKLRGKCVVSVNYNDHHYQLPLIVVDNVNPPLLGLQWIRALQLDLKKFIHDTSSTDVIHSISHSTDLQLLLSKFSNVLTDKLGHCTKMKAHIELQPNSIPKFFKPRAIPFTYIDRVKAEIDRKVKAGILERIDSSLWAAPIVPVLKPNGKIRVCGDFKVTINPYTLVDQHPLPSIDELFPRLRGGKQFSKLDLSDAYLQMELDEISQTLVVINTPSGLYRYTRMPFGISSAPAIFQRLIDQVIHDIPNCVAYIDDLLITGSTESEHLTTLEQVLIRLADYGFTCHPDKCVFFQDSVSYLDFRLDKHGKLPDPTRVESIVNMPPPKNIKELEAFIGKINYYDSFISNFSSKCKVLNNLRKKNVRWYWSTDCNRVFQQLLVDIATATTLVHFDDKLPILLATNASQYGIGAVYLTSLSRWLGETDSFCIENINRC